jgi:hypothetical protein
MADLQSTPRRGQPIRFRAEDMSEILRAIRNVRNEPWRTFNQQGRTLGNDPSGIIAVRNSSGDTLNAGDVAIVKGAAITSEDPVSFQYSPIVDLDAADETRPSGIAARYVVCQEAMQDGFVGRARIQGVTAVKVSITAATDEYAEFDGHTYLVTQAAAGSAAILWKESGTGANKWALVEIGGGGGGGGSDLTVDDVIAAGLTIPLTFAYQSGDMGDYTHQCEALYDVSLTLNPGAGVILSDADPGSSPHHWKRTSVGMYNAADAGLGHYEGEDLIIDYCNEYPVVGC